MSEADFCDAYERGRALENLGLLDEAEIEFRSIPESSPYFSYALEQIVTLYSRDGRQEQASELGLCAIHNGCSDNYGLVFSTALALHYCKRYSEARAILTDIEPPSHFFWVHLYELACLEARLCNYSAAIELLARVLHQETWRRSVALVDSDFREMWRYFSNRRPAPRDAMMLTSFGILPLEGMAPDVSVQPLLDMPDYLAMPKKFRPLLTRCPIEGRVVLRWQYVQTHQCLWAAFLKWKNKMVQRTARHVDKAISRSRPISLDVHLSVVWKSIDAGDLFGAREYLMDALRISGLKASLALTLMPACPIDYFISEIVEGEAAYPDFVRTVNACRDALNARDTETARAAFETFPTFLSTNLAVQEIECRILCREERNEEAISAGTLLCQKWPIDPVGWGSILHALSSLNRWEECEIIYHRAPKSYRVTRQCECMGMLIENHHKEIASEEEEGDPGIRSNP